MASAHVVQDLEFEVDFESEEQAFDLHERLSAFAHGPALRIVAEVFDQACPEADVLHLERLEVDLGIVDPGELEPQWEARLRARLRRALANLPSNASPPMLPGAAAAMRRTSARQAELEALLHYLRRGVLPWHAAASTDPAELAGRVWRNDSGALLARLRGWPDAQTAARRMARQFPVSWCRQLAKALGADAGSVRESGVSGPSEAAAVERQLLQALLGPATAMSPTPDTPELRAARRRWRALLVDDAPELVEDDLGELMQLWQSLQHQDPDGLLQDLQTLGSRARVRRRMAQLWPESLLRQLPRLWLGEEEGRRVSAVLEGTLADAGAGGRRRRWEALLRLLWAGPGVERIDAAQLLAEAMQGRAEAQHAVALRSGPVRAQVSLALPQPPAEPEPPSVPVGWAALLSSAGDAAAGRAALRESLSSAQGRRRLASVITASELARGLALWWPAPEAKTLAVLAFAPLPAAWRREGEPFPHTERLVHCTLQALHETTDVDWTAQGLVLRWSSAVAVQLQRSPDELARALHAAGAVGDEAALRSAWARWLPPPRPRPASTSAAAVSEALRQGDRAALQAGWRALLDAGASAARARLRQLGDTAEVRAGLARQLSDEQWLQLLGVFMAPGQAQTVARAQHALQRALGELSEAAEPEVALRGWTLAALLWQPAAAAEDVAGYLLEQGARRAGLTVAALLRLFPPDEQGPFAAHAADLEVLDIHTRPRRAAADEATSLRHQAEAEAVAKVIAALRGAGLSVDLAGGEQALLMALTDRDSAPAREAIARELESAQAARLLSRALPADELLRLVAWLRPFDREGLRQAWPRLQALTEGQGTQAWPRVARAVLRELFEEDRPLLPPALLQRAERAMRSAPHLPSNPRELAQPDEPLFVNNAGIVLLAPYLQRLFGMLGLANDKTFVDAEAAERAVAVMQYAATGDAAVPETRLPLNKLLCGLPLQAPVLRDVELERSEREAVDGMLGAVIGHWKALGQTSVAGLRQTFLERAGRLDHREDAWHLQVPTQTFDMLIDRLPWGFSTIRYPWMPEVLHVQWR